MVDADADAASAAIFVILGHARSFQFHICFHLCVDFTYEFICLRC